MYKLKFFLLFIIIRFTALSQQVQPFPYKDNSFPWSVNIGDSVLKTTQRGSWLELGDSLHSKKGLTNARGVTAEILFPTPGMQIYDRVRKTIAFYNDTGWVYLPYSSGATIDTSGKWINRVYRKAGSDSVFYVIGGIAMYAFRDSIGITDISSKLNISDTALMLLPYHLTFSKSLVKTASDVTLVHDSVFTSSNEPYNYTFDGAQLGWRPTLYYELTNPQALDALVLKDSTGNTVINIPAAPAGSCIVFDPGWYPTVVDIDSLHYMVTESHYTVTNTGQHYIYPATIVTLPVGTAAPGEKRFDYVGIAAGSGPGSLQGDNGADGVARTPDYTNCEFFPLITVEIDEDDVVPAPASTSTNRKVFDEHTGPPGEATMANIGTITVNYDATTGTPPSGTKAINVTAANNNAGFRASFPDTLQTYAYPTLTGRFRTNANLNTSTNWAVRLRFGATVSPLIQITGKGVSKTGQNNQWQYFTFNLPGDFATFPRFTAIEFIRQGTGSQNVYFDNILLQKMGGTVVGSSQAAISQVVSEYGIFNAAGPNSKINVIGDNTYIFTSILGDTLKIDATSLDGTFLPLSFTSSKDIYINGNELNINAGNSSSTGGITIQNFSYGSAVNLLGYKSADSLSSLGVNYEGVMISGSVGASHSYQLQIGAIGMSYTSGADTAKYFSFPFKRNTGYQGVLLYDSSTHTVAYAPLSSLGIGGGGGGTDSPDRINGTATTSVNADMGANDFVVFTSGGNGLSLTATGDVSFGNSDMGFEMNLSAGTITLNDNSTGIGLQYAASYYAAQKSLGCARCLVDRGSAQSMIDSLATAVSSGNAATASALQTARNINGVAFDGTANITVTAAAGTLTGTTLNSTVVSSSLTSHGTITSGGLGTGAVIGGVTMTLGSDANYDLYYRNSSGVLTRLANGTTGQFLAATTGSAPSWGSVSVAVGSISGLGTGVGTFLATPSSANLISAMSDETGTGALVFANTPTLVTPVLGVATATSVNKVTITAPATAATLTIANNGSLITSGAFALTFTASATSNATIPAGTNTLYSTLSGSITSAQLATSLTNETGSGVVVYGTSPTFTTSITLPTGSTSQAPVIWVSGSLKTTATAATQEYNGSFYEAKASGLRYGRTGVIASFTSDVSNTGTTESDLYTYTTPASTLANTGEAIRFELTLKNTDATADIDYSIYFAGTKIYQLSGGAGPQTIGAATAKVQVTIIRTGSTTARATITDVNSGAGFAISETDMTGITFTNTNIIKATATLGGAGGGTGDLVAKMGIIEWLPVAAN